MRSESLPDRAEPESNRNTMIHRRGAEARRNIKQVRISSAELLPGLRPPSEQRKRRTLERSPWEGSAFLRSLCGRSPGWVLAALPKALIICSSPRLGASASPRFGFTRGQAKAVPAAAL